MKLTRNMLSDAVRTCLALGAVGVLGFTAAPAFAQEESQTLERVEVTGSRIRSADVETAQPVFSISREDIINQGFASVGDILTNLTVAGSPPISRTAPLSAGENVGGVYIDLRDLGAQRTLVLVNGRRLPITTSGLQDVSAIPATMVERIDIQKDGASSIYGSDAIAGVVNIITRKQFNGLEVGGYYGQYDEGDGIKERLSGTIGASNDRGYITLGMEYRQEDGVWAKDRWFSEVSYPGFPQYGWTTVGQYGGFIYNGSRWVADRPGPAIGFENFHVQTANDRSYPSDQMHWLTPLEARTLSISAGYDLSDSIRLVTDIGYSNRIAQSQIAGYPLQGTQARGGIISAPAAYQLDANSYFNPVGTNVSWWRRGWDVPRGNKRDLKSWRFTTALEGSFNFGETHYMDWDVGMMYADNDLNITGTGNFNLARLNLATGPSFLNAQGIVQCGTPANPIPVTACVPFNPFAGYGAGAVENSLADPNVQNFVFFESHALGETKTYNYFANFSGNAFALPAGDLTYAVGFERRKEKGTFVPDVLQYTNASTDLGSGPTRGEYDVDEVYAELNVPLLSGVTGFQDLTLSLASRYSDYSSFGDTTNSKAGFTWKPIDDLLVRATWAEGFRAPTISNLYGGGSQTFTTGFVDPCDTRFGVAANTPRCLQDVGPGYRQLQQGFIPTETPGAQTPVPFFSGSNPFLQPESSTSWTAGLVWSPSFLDGFNASLDWWKIRVENTMVSDTANAIVSDCYVALIESRCALFTRDPVLGIVNNLTYGLRNSGWTEIEGFDLGLAYRFETDNLGSFLFNWDTTYFSKYLSTSTNDPDVIPAPAVGFYSRFRVRSNAGVTWNFGDFGVSWNARYFSSVKEDCYFDEFCNIPNYQAPWTQGNVVPMNKVGSTTFNDLQVRWNAPWNATISVGANNVFEKYGPIMYTQPNSGFSYYGGYDFGRFTYVKYDQRF
ncbi:TonB-dependent receptor [Xanthomonadaceae bacterium XH05]|nr:TonB-dependent receptor [Xanthomonadaceae bacterium XH05]